MLFFSGGAVVVVVLSSNDEDLPLRRGIAMRERRNAADRRNSARVNMIRANSRGL